MNLRKLSIITGLSYFIIFFAAIFANFFAIEALMKNPLETIQQNHLLVRFGILAFLVTVVFDVVVAWALYLLYKSNYLSSLSTLFRMMHAAIMGVAIFALPLTFKVSTSNDILNHVHTFNTIWLIGLFFFGIHLILLGRIINTPKFITLFVILAGVMYMIDTCAHFLLPDYDAYSSIFLALVAIPSIIGEMSLAIWLLLKGFKNNA
ncbi:DUF4386 domain-containing protein [Aestuariibaculum lutulentum]|uniref:DUF4386 domain-containing protein n=1 Tax=Aestuariibaculum lutulentum TaxID=2920935 RepID=A0ABS9RJM2_9FLAO|nr:DUF4386 domain-containing protein [Aestuariibaculum lutulentum]MCH4553154.1 DUF4386 domain-containing protein [Aestuariibaculum lutulentum]